MPDYILSFDPAIVNMAYCCVNADTLKIHKWGQFSIKDSTNEGTCKKLIKELDQINLEDLEDLENLIIVHEQQPRCNVKTVTICGQLQMYYVLKKLETNYIKKIVGHHAKYKIKYYEPLPGDEPMPSRINNLKKGHYKTKQILIEHCKRILKHNNELEWLDSFEKKSKKDDLGDSYVQALSYIKLIYNRK